MALHRCIAVAALTAIAATAVACGSSTDTPSVDAAEKHPATLEALMREIRDAVLKDDKETVKRLALSMVPTTAELRRLLRAGPDTDAFVSKFRAVKDPDGKPNDKLGDGPISVTPEFRKRTEIHVYEATTEELAKYEKGSVAFLQFPGGMRRFAQQVAAPGRTWFCVTFVEPGEPLGTKFTSFTRLDDRFLIVAKPWRAVPQAPAEEATEPGSDSK